MVGAETAPKTRLVRLGALVVGLAMVSETLAPLAGAQTEPQPQVEVPGRPAGLHVTTEQGSLSVGLDWDDVDGASGYRVRWRRAGPGHQLNEGVQPGTSEATITVADYGEWVVRIEACNEAGCGPPLAQRFGVKAAPDPPPEDEAPPEDETEPPEEDETEPPEEDESEPEPVSQAPVLETSVLTLGAAVVLTFDRDLQVSPAPGPGQFTVTATGADGSTATITVNKVTVEGRTVLLKLARAPLPTETLTVAYTHLDSAPLRAAAGGAPVPDITASQVSGNQSSAPAAPTSPGWERSGSSINLTWTAPADNGSAITDYDVQYRTTGEATWTDHDHVGTATSTTITGLNCGSQYVTRVRAVNAIGPGDWSGGSTTAVNEGNRDRNGPRAYCATAVGKTLRIWFHRSLGTSFLPGPGVFSVTVGTQTAAPASFRVSGRSAILTLSTPARFGQSVSVTYTRPTGGGANRLADASWGDSVRTFTQSAENDTPQFSTPTFDAGDNATRSINENHANNAVVGTVAATDQDGDTLTYSLDAAAQSTFTIDSSGVIRVATGVTLDHETTASYTITAQVTDGEDASGNPESPATIDDSITVTINVNDVDEPPGKVGQPTVTARREGLSASWSAPSNTGPAVDDYDVQVRQQGTQPWIGVPHTGAATSAAFSGLTAGTVYEVQVRAANEDGNGAWSDSATGTPLADTGSSRVVSNLAGSPTFGFALNTLDASVGFTTATTGSAYVLTSVDVVFREAPSEVTVRLATGLPGNTTQVAKLASPIRLSSGRLKFTAVQDILLSRGTTYWVVVEGAAGNVAGRQGSGQGDEDAGSVTGWTIADTALRRQRASTGSWTSSTIGMRIGINGFAAANTSPSFGTGAPTSLTIAENSPAGTTVGTVAATDPEGDTLTYSLDATSDAVFDIDASGVITVQAGAQLDHETTASYTATVSVSDSKALDGTADTAVDATRAVMITVSNVIELPGKPTQVRASTAGAVSGDTVTVTWDPPADADGTPAVTDYDVRYYEGNAPPADATDWIEPDEPGGHDHYGSDTEATVTGLTESTTYQFQVRAKNSDGTGEWSDAGAASTTAGHTLLTLVSNTEQFIDSFSLWRQTNKSRTQAQAFTTGGSANGYKLTSVSVRLTFPNNVATEPEPDYTVAVHEVASNGNPGTSLGTLTNPSQIAQGINEFTAPGAGIDLAADTTYMVVIAPTVTEDRRRMLSRMTSFDREDDGAAAEWSIADVARARLEGGAWGKIGNASLMIAVRGYIKPAPPGVPQTVNAGAIGDINADSFTVSWSAPANPGSSDITDYDVRYASGSAAPADDSDDWIEEGETGGHDHVGTATEAVLSGLTASTTYWVQVRATNADGTGAWSAAATVRTPPSGLTVTRLVGNLEQRSNFLAGHWDAGDHAQAFTTGASPGGYKLTAVSIDLWVHDRDLADPDDPDYSVSVWTANAQGRPDTSLGTLVKPSSLVHGLNVFAAPGDGITLAASTAYVVLMDVGTVSGRKWVAVLGTELTDEDDGTADGWSLADRSISRARTGDESNWRTSSQSISHMAVDGYALPAAPGKPRAVQAGATGDVTGDSFTVSWTAPASPGTSAITDYDVRYYAGTAPPADDDDWIEAGETGGHDHVGTATTARLTGLTASTAYLVQVRARNAVGAGEWSDAGAGITTSGPTADTLVSRVGQSTGVYRGWTLGSTVQHYAQRFATGSSSNGYVLTSLNLVLDIGSLHLPEPDYTVTIRSPDAQGNPGTSLGELTKPAQLLPGVNAFSAPAGGIALEANKTYLVTIIPTVTADRKAVNVEQTLSTEHDAGAAPGWSTQHRGHVRDVGGTWGTFAGSVKMAIRGYTALAPPGKPTEVAAGQTGSVTGNSFIVSWAAPADAGTSAISDYDVRYYAGSAPPHYARDWIEADEIGGHDHVGTATQATLAGLTKSTTYWVQVRASNDDGPGEWSDAVGVTTTSGATVSTLVSNESIVEVANPSDSPWTTSPRAQLVMSGSDTNGYKLTAVHLRLAIENPNLADPDYTVTIRPAIGSGASAVPGDSVGELAKPSSLASGINVFTALGDGIFLDPGTAYFVHVKATHTAGRKSVKFVTVSSNDEEAGAAAGWSIADGLHIISAGVWSGGPASARIVVRGYADAPLAGTPGAPTGLMASSSAIDSLMLSWDAPASAGDTAITDYDIRYYRGTAPPAKPSQWITAGEPGGHDHVGTARRSTIGGLDTGTSYQVQVRATNSVGPGAWSTAVAGTTDAPAAARLVSSLNQGAWQNDLWSARDAAQAFTTGSNLGGYRLTGVEFQLSVAGAGSDPDYEVSLHEANADGGPGASIGTLNKPSSLVDGINTFSAPGDGLDLESRTTYVVVIDVGTVSGRKNVQTRNTNSDSEDTGAASGWSIADGSLTRLRVNVDAWTAQSDARRFAVSGFAKLPSAELVSNIGQADATATSWNTHDHAQGFTTGPSAGGYILTGVDMQLSVTGTGSDPDYSVTIRSSGFDVVGTLVKPSSLATGVNTFRAPGSGIELAAGATYYVLVDVGEISGRKTVQFANTASPSEDSGKADGWSLADFGNRRVRTAGANIIPSHQTQARKIAVHGYAPTAAPGTPTDVLAGVYGDLTASAFLVSWTAPEFAGTSAITGYDVRYYAGSAPPADEEDWIEPGEPGGHARTGSVDQTTLSGLDASTTYQVQVRAASADGTSDWSDTAAATTSSGPTVTTQVSNLGLLGVGTLIAGLASESDLGQEFTTGTAVGGYQLNALNLWLWVQNFDERGNAVEGDPDIAVSIRTRTEGGDPDTVVGTLIGPPRLQHGVNTFRAAGDGIRLAAETSYFAVLEVGMVSGRRVVRWLGTDLEEEDAGVAAGWNIADGAVNRDRTSTATTWVKDSRSVYMLSVRGHEAVPITLSVARVSPSGADDSVDEGSSATFRITATRDPNVRSAAVSLPLSLLDSSTATAGTDYTELASLPTISIAENQASATAEVTIATTQDRLVEGAETIVLGGTATGFVVNPVTVSIADNDSASTSIGLSVSPTSLTESDAATQVTVTAAVNDGAVEADTTLRLSLSGTATGGGTDYTAPASLTDNNVDITVAAGQTSASAAFSIDPVSDTVDEGTGETIIFEGTKVSGDTSIATVSSATLTIKEQVITLSLSPASAGEAADATTVTVTATRDTNVSTDAVSVSVTVGATGSTAERGSDKDYTGDTTATIQIAANEASGTVEVSIDPVADAVADGDKTVVIDGSATGFDVTEATFTIVDDDISLAVSPATLAEGAAATDVTVTATLGSAIAAAAEITVTLSLGGTATSGTDYTPPASLPAITIAAGESSGTATLRFAPLTDKVVDPGEKIAVTGTAAGRTVTDGEISITDATEMPDRGDAELHRGGRGGRQHHLDGHRHSRQLRHHQGPGHRVRPRRGGAAGRGRRRHRHQRHRLRGAGDAAHGDHLGGPAQRHRHHQHHPHRRPHRRGRRRDRPFGRHRVQDRRRKLPRRPADRRPVGVRRRPRHRRQRRPVAAVDPPRVESRFDDVVQRAGLHHRRQALPRHGGQHRSRRLQGRSVGNDPQGHHQRLSHWHQLLPGLRPRRAGGHAVESGRSHRRRRLLLHGPRGHLPRPPDELLAVDPRGGLDHHQEGDHHHRERRHEQRGLDDGGSAAPHHRPHRLRRLGQRGHGPPAGDADNGLRAGAVHQSHAERGADIDQRGGRRAGGDRHRDARRGGADDRHDGDGDVLIGRNRRPRPRQRLRGAARRDRHQHDRIGHHHHPRRQRSGVEDVPVPAGRRQPRRGRKRDHRHHRRSRQRLRR